MSPVATSPLLLTLGCFTLIGLTVLVVNWCCVVLDTLASGIDEPAAEQEDDSG